MLLEDSFCDCIFGGRLIYFFDCSKAVKFGVGGRQKCQIDYIKEGFDWLAEQENKIEKQEISFTRLDEAKQPVL